MLTKPQKVFLAIAAIFYTFAGVLHFVRTSMYVKIMPPYVPWHLAMVYVSGAAEILGGVALLIPPVRRSAALGLVALLIAVFPAMYTWRPTPLRQEQPLFHRRRSGDGCCSSQFLSGGYCGARSRMAPATHLVCRAPCENPRTLPSRDRKERYSIVESFQGVDVNKQIETARNGLTRTARPYAYHKDIRCPATIALSNTARSCKSPRH
jgi:uncharacterized membrane protein